MPKRSFRRAFKRSYRKFRGNRRLTKRVKRVERGIKKINSAIETKCINILGLTGQGLSTIGSVSGGVQTSNFSTAQNLLLNSIGSGSADGQRVGNKVRLTSLTMNLSITGPTYVTGGYDSFSNVRIVIFRVKNWNASTTIAYSDYFTPPSGAVYGHTALYNWDNRKNFKVIWDKTMTVNEVVGGTGADDMVRNIKKTIKLKFNTYYTGTGTGGGSIMRNALFIAAWSDSSVAPNPQFAGVIRLKYQDI